MEKYNSHDFFSHEDELSFLAKDICIQNKNEKIKNIGLITNDRYFARRLRALLARNNIEVNDDSGWVLSTSSCCSYINNIMNYFFENNSYSSLRDILKSPYFQIKMTNHEKNKLLEKIVLHQKGNININIVNFKNKNKFFDVIDNYGIDGDFIESQAFSYIAVRSILNLPISFPHTTGCKKECSGGVIL